MSNTKHHYQADIQTHHSGGICPKFYASNPEEALRIALALVDKAEIETPDFTPCLVKIRELFPDGSTLLVWTDTTGFW